MTGDRALYGTNTAFHVDAGDRPEFSTSQAERVVPQDCKLRRVKYLNNVIELDHRFIKKKVRASQCFKHFHIAERTLEGIEAVTSSRSRHREMDPTTFRASK